MSTNTIQMPEGYQQTKVGIIPKDWEVKKIKEIASIKTGNRDTQDKVEDGEYPFFVRSQTIENINSYSFDGEAVLTSGDGVGVGKIFHYIKGKFDFHQRVYNIHKFNPNLKGIYFYFYFASNFYERAIKLSAKNSVDSVRMEMISNMLIPIPPLPEQKEIADCLSIWDNAIEKQQALIEQRELRKKGLMQQLLSGKERLKGFSDKWEEMKLGEIADRVVRKNIEGDNNIVTISAQKGFIKQGEFFSKRIASETVYDYTLVHRGEFCYNKSYSNGYPMGVFKRLDNFEKGVVTTLYICFRINQFAHSEFMVNYFDFGMLNQGLMKVAKEGGRAHGLLNISLSDFFNLKLALPSLKEQTAIAGILNIADREIDLEKQRLQKLKDQKKGLMQQLLTGKKRLID